jgi:hypothetical protein
MFFPAEVIETKMAFKPNQKDDKGNVLPLGSILIRQNSNSTSGQVRNFYARPFGFMRRLPLIGEHVLIMQVPVHDKSSASATNSGYVYISPYNSTDDLSLHQFPKLWERSNHYDSKVPTVKSDRKEIGYNYVKSSDIKQSYNIQPYEGDDIIESRFGSSLRLGASIEKDKSIYDQKPTWQGKNNGDPIIILRNSKPNSTANRLTDITNVSASFNNKYQVEDIDKDESSLYLTSTQKLSKFKAGFSKNRDAKTIANWNRGSQVALSADRIILNAKSDKLLLLAKTEAILSSDKVLFQTNKYKVQLDDLMDYIDSIAEVLWQWATAQKQFLTSMGPTATSTNIAEVTRLHKTTFTTKFKRP